MGRLSGGLTIFLFWILAIGWGGGVAKASPGEVDPSFGEKGLVVQRGHLLEDVDPAGPYGEDMAVGPEDAIFLLLSYRSCGLDTCTVELFVQRHLPNGALDESFGEEGTSSKVTVITHVKSQQFYGTALHGSLAVNSKGEPVVAAVNNGDVTLFRLEQSGKLAGDFGGGDGIVTTDFGNGVVKPQLAVSRDGRIVVATGFWQRSGDRRFVILARYEPSGDLDPSFGAGTPESEPAGWMAIKGSRPAALALSPAGGTVLAGGRCCPSATQTSVYLGRRGSNGRPLSPYSPSSPWRHIKVGEHATVTSVTALPRGKVYLVGHSSSGLFAARALPSGRLDRTFGRAGVVRLKKMFGGASPALADRAGRLYVAGFRGGGEEFAADRALLARLTRNGRLDRRWGSSPAGYALMPVWISDALALAFQSNGKLVVFGEILGGCVRTCPLPGRTLTRLLTGSAPRRR